MLALVSQARSSNMRAIKSANTKPEMIVRRLAHGMGLRYRLHRKDLAGSPDIVFPRHNAVIFVHGCFWHGHGCKRGGQGPKSNAGYWGPKIARTQLRDAKAVEALEEIGWRVLTIWECELGHADTIRKKISQFVTSENVAAVTE